MIEKLDDWLLGGMRDAFHDEFLKDGCMPLEVAEKEMDRWAERAEIE